MATYEILKAQLERYPELENDMKSLAEFTTRKRSADFAGFIGYDKDGEEKITAFNFKGNFVTNYRSFLTGQPSDHYIQALLDSVIYIINLQDLQSLYDKHKNIERLGRLIAENLYLTVANRLDSFMFQTPSERYKELIERNSRLLQEIPQYMIASYLGVKPETLSRIRKRK
jgi:CRP-like cAMP-binding protein